MNDLPADDDLEVVPPEKSAALLGWSLSTLIRRSKNGSGPSLIKLSPRRSGCLKGEIRKFLSNRAAA
jgi:predicted DNA-binding transcriptional regulator AlpA